MNKVHTKVKDLRKGLLYLKVLDKKWIHLINIILGVIIVPYSILEFVGVFKLGEDTIYSVIPIGLFLLWFVMYIIQVKKRHTLIVMSAVFLNVFYLFFVIPRMLY
ncbi:MAG: hypothetical protein WCF60_18440 [Anaerobacillus sp.]